MPGVTRADLAAGKGQGISRSIPPMTQDPVTTVEVSNNDDEYTIECPGWAMLTCTQLTLLVISLTALGFGIAGTVLAIRNKNDIA